MKKGFFILFFICKLLRVVSGQNSFEIEGRIIHKITKEPIPYATIYNKGLKLGTISNIDGYFRIALLGYRDTIRISYIGFKDHNIKLEEGLNFYQVNLEENFHLLNEITVTPGNNSYLYQLIQDCKQKSSKADKSAKSYYELKSFINGKQVEFVEGYYNADIKSYKLEGLQFKNGRIALQAYRDRFFVSIESSRAILMLDLLRGNDQFPINPLELSKSKCKKNFSLSLDNIYLDENSDSIYVVEYYSSDTTGMFFTGNIWINKTKKQFIKINLNCSHARKFPFLPIFPTDSISNVSFAITQSYKYIADQSYFHHIDFVYKFDYQSRIGNAEEKSYSIVTNAVLHAYDYEQLFCIPIFDESFNDMDDYRKVNVAPYNEFFWNYNDEYRLNDSLDNNELFFLDSNSVNNRALFKSNKFAKLGLLEHPYVEWSNARIKLREILPDSLSYSPYMNVKSDQFNLSVKIYLDVNLYRDSMHITTSTVFDPYHSYYHLQMDHRTQCFINIYFDLYEIKRRELLEKMSAVGSNLLLMKEIYYSNLKDIESEFEVYLRAVQRGTNELELKKYNDHVYNKLGIDNFKYFQILEK